MKDATSSVDGVEKFATGLESSRKDVSDCGDDDEADAFCEAFLPVNDSQSPILNDRKERARRRGKSRCVAVRDARGW